MLVNRVRLGFVETLDRLALLVSKDPKDKLVQLDPSETLVMLAHQARLDLQVSAFCYETFKILFFVSVSEYLHSAIQELVQDTGRFCIILMHDALD